MAVSTINPYSGGAVVFDQRPWMAYYERQMARQQAKNDAMDNYFRDLNKNITSTGMRSQDVPGLLQKQNAWQQYNMQNKKEILNPKLDGGKAYTTSQAMYQDQLAHINESKESQKTVDELGKLKFNKDFNYIFDDPHTMIDIESDQLPIGDPNRRKLNISQMMVPPQPIGIKQREDFDKYTLGNSKPDEIRGTPLNIGNYQTQTPIISQYSDKNLRIFAQRAADVYDTDRSWRAEANKTFQETIHDPIKHQQLNSISQKYFGKDIDNARDAFIAQTIANHDTRSIKYEKGDDVYGRSLALAGVQHGYRLSEDQAKQKMKDKSLGQQDDIIDQVYNGLKEDAKKNKAIYEPTTGQPYEQYSIKASPTIKKMFAVPDDKGHLIYPDDIRFSKDFTEVTPIFFEHKTLQDEKGNIKRGDINFVNGRAKVDKDKSQPIMEAEFKQRYKKELMGAGAYGRELSKGAPKEEARVPASTNDWRSRAKKVQ